MAEDRLKENQFDKQGVNPFNAPIPGESLTTTSDVPHSWERPPNILKKMIVWKNIYLELTKKNLLPELLI